MKLYTGSLDQRKGFMSPTARRAYFIYNAQRKRAGVLYAPREFIAWYIAEWKRLKPKGRYDVARKDHAKPYSFDNIELQPVLENMRERNDRCGNPAKSKKVLMEYVNLTGKIYFNSMKKAAEQTGIDRKTIYNHVTGRTKNPWKFGPCKHMQVRFSWC